MRADEKSHYNHLASLLTAAGQTPATSGDIDFSYPKGSFRSQASILRLAGRLEHLMVGAYVGAVENVETPQLRLPIGQIAANEAQHRECGRCARRPVGDREGVRAGIADRGGVRRVGRVRELTMAKQQYTASEAAAALGISLDTLRRWDQAGRIRVTRDRATAGSCRRRRSTGCAATARALTSPLATASGRP